ncbi:vexin [Pseudophryne corroboree]|uniref:vexin n=1 Tax=Pseudophryne corroboree TaxID=495146 RepID=UPI003081A2F8
MNKICTPNDDTLQIFNPSFTTKAHSTSRRRVSSTQRTTPNSVTAISGAGPHWTQKYLPQQTDLLQVLYTAEDVWKLPPPEPFRPRRSNKHRCTEIKTPKSVKSTQTVQLQNKRLPQSSLGHSMTKHIASTLPTTHVTAVTVGCNNPRPFHTEDDGLMENEDYMPLTPASIPKKSPTLLQKMGLRLRKTVEYIGASNCAFEGD